MCSIRNALREAKKPMCINEIMEHIGIKNHSQGEGYRIKISLSICLAEYTRRGLFKRVSRGVYCLVEFDGADKK